MVTDLSGIHEHALCIFHDGNLLVKL